MRSRTLEGIRTPSLLALAVVLLHVAPRAHAEAPAPSVPRRPPMTTAAATPAPSASETDAPIGRARELLARARLLDEAAASDEKLAGDLARALPALRLAAKAARDRAARSDATRADHDAIVARAEELEAEVAVDEVDVAVKRHAAAENRRSARELRLLAVRIVKEPPAIAETVATTPCDPPYRFTNDGRKIYRVECF